MPAPPEIAASGLISAGPVPERPPGSSRRSFGRGRFEGGMVELGLDFGQPPRLLVGPRLVTRTVFDHHPRRQAGAELQPAVVAFDPDADRDALNDLRELAGNHI